MLKFERVNKNINNKLKAILNYKTNLKIYKTKCLPLQTNKIIKNTFLRKRLNNHHIKILSN